MRTSISLLLLLTLAACGSADPKADGFAALGSGDFATASTELAKALEGLSPGDPGFAEVAVGRCQALAHVDGDKAKDEFLALAASGGDALSDRDYSLIVSEMVSAGAYAPAVAVLDDGIKRFTESPKLSQLKDKVIEASKKAGDADALQALEGLGYL